MTNWLTAVAFAPFVLAAAVVCIRQPMRVALPLYVALVPFGGLLSLGGSKFSSASSVAGLLLIVGLASQVLRSRAWARRLPTAVPIWLFFLATAAVTVLWTVKRADTIQGLKVLGPLVVIFVLGALSKVDRTILRRTENALLVGGSAAVLYGLFQVLVLGGFAGDTPGGGLQTQQGRFGNDMLGPNIQSVTLLIPMAVAMNRAFNPEQKRRPVLHAAVAALMVVGILMTGSRTGTLAAGVVVLAMLVTSPRQARKGLGQSLALGSLAALAVWTFHPLGLADRTYETASSSSGRLDIWRVGLAACDQYCALGSGWGTFPEVYARTQASVPGAAVLVGRGGSYEPHNVWLLALIETGILGVLLLSAGLAVNLLQALRLPGAYRPTAVGASVGLMLALVFLSSMEFKIFWVALLLVVMYRNSIDLEAAVARRTAARSPTA